MLLAKHPLYTELRHTVFHEYSFEVLQDSGIVTKTRTNSNIDRTLIFVDRSWEGNIYHSCYRIDIHSESIPSQTYARLEKWTDVGWKPISNLTLLSYYDEKDIPTTNLQSVSLTCFDSMILNLVDLMRQINGWKHNRNNRGGIHE